jgi:hypothetical protein
MQKERKNLQGAERQTKIRETQKKTLSLVVAPAHLLKIKTTNQPQPLEKTNLSLARHCPLSLSPESPFPS